MEVYDVALGFDILYSHACEWVRAKSKYHYDTPSPNGSQ